MTPDREDESARRGYEFPTHRTAGRHRATAHRPAAFCTRQVRTRPRLVSILQDAAARSSPESARQSQPGQPLHAKAWTPNISSALLPAFSAHLRTREKHLFPLTEHLFAAKKHLRAFPAHLFARKKHLCGHSAQLFARAAHLFSIPPNRSTPPHTCAEFPHTCPAEKNTCAPPPHNCPVAAHTCKTTLHPIP